MRVQTGLTAVGISEFIGTGLDIYGRYKEITEAPAYAREAETLRVQLAVAEAEAARTRADMVKKVVLYGGISLVAVVVLARLLKKKR